MYTPTMKGLNFPQDLLNQAGSWGDISFKRADAYQPRLGGLPHSDSGVFMSTKPANQPALTYGDLPAMKDLATFTPDSSPPLPIAAPLTRARSGKGKAALLGASAADTIDVDAIPTMRPQASGRATQKAPRGRSLGDKSTGPIKHLRALAEGGCIESALKLGWAVERLTKMFNADKVKRGVPVTSELQPIDDPILLAKIEDRKQNARLATQRRTDRLKAKAAAGDFDAARKLGLGKKSMEDLVQKFGKEKGRKVKREKLSPAEPRDFDAEWQQDIEQDRFEFLSRAPSMSSAEAASYVKTEEGDQGFRASQFHDQRTTIRDSFGKAQNFPAFQPLPAFTPSMPAAYPSFVPSNATPQPNMPQLACPPSVFRQQVHLPTTNRAMELDIKLDERTKFLEYANFLVREIHQEIHDYQVSQARMAPSNFSSYPQDTQPSATGHRGQLPTASSSKEFHWIAQTGLKETDLEEDMQTIE